MFASKDRYSRALGVCALAVAAACGQDPDGPAVVTGHPQGIIVASPSLSDRPYGAAISSEGVAYVTRLDAFSMAGGAVSSHALGDSVVVGSVPTSVAFAPGGATAYVANQWSSYVGVVDVGTGIENVAIVVSGDPFYVLVAPSGDTVFCTLNTNVVAVISSDAVVDEIAVGSVPNGLVMGPSGGFLYVSDAGSGEVSEIDLSTGTVPRTFTVGGTPQGIDISPDGATLYVANEAGPVWVVDVASGTVVGSVPAASGGFGIAISPDGAVIYVSRKDAGEVAVIDRATLTVVHTLATGGMPRRIAFNRDGTIAIVANEAGWVDFIQ